MSPKVSFLKTWAIGEAGFLGSIKIQLKWQANFVYRRFDLRRHFQMNCRASKMNACRKELILTDSCCMYTHESQIFCGSNFLSYYINSVILKFSYKLRLMKKLTSERNYGKKLKEW